MRCRQCDERGKFQPLEKTGEKFPRVGRDEEFNHRGEKEFDRR